MKVLVETSARHVHLSQEHLEILFGKGHELTVKKMLSQPGQFACEEKVDIVGPKKTLTGIRVLGPARKETQVELALTDARTIGIKAPVRESGKLEGTPGCKLVGPCGEVELDHGVNALDLVVDGIRQTALAPLVDRIDGAVRLDEGLELAHQGGGSLLIQSGAGNQHGFVLSHFSVHLLLDVWPLSGQGCGAKQRAAAALFTR